MTNEAIGLLALLFIAFFIFLIRSGKIVDMAYTKSLIIDLLNKPRSLENMLSLREAFEEIDRSGVWTNEMIELYYQYKKKYENI